MSKMSNAVNKMNEANELHKDHIVTNFMGGDSYVINPLDTLKMISASSIFGEPQYYRDSRSAKKSALNRVDKTVEGIVDDLIMSSDAYEGKTTEDILETAIDNALDYDFGATIRWARTLRNDFYMRLNPQVIMVRAAIHPKRIEFTQNNPGEFNAINKELMRRADEPLTQMTYYLYNNDGKKNNIPSILKRSWANVLSNLDRYQVAKYKNHEIGMINGVRLCHANSPVLDELMKTGTVVADEEEATWENLRSTGKPWKEIFETVNMGHMALLRNLRGVFTDTSDIDFCDKYLEKLKAGVVKGKQFPFRYYTAMQMIEKSEVNFKSKILNALEECMDISLENYPKLKGRTMCLSDNSGSAWGAFTSEFGTVTVANIDNLSSVITAACSDDGYVGKFGDKLKVFPVIKRRGVLSQAKEISSNQYADVGGSTEGGIWEFFKKAIDEKEHWDNIFIYSDMQAGHGGLYGTRQQAGEYSKRGFAVQGYGWNPDVNVYALIKEYRKKVNPKVNVFCIQTAGYDSVLVPELTYRTSIQYGWTGKEAVFAEEYIKLWDEVESRKNNTQ